jgi:hypothetical protein
LPIADCGFEIENPGIKIFRRFLHWRLPEELLTCRHGWQ